MIIVVHELKTEVIQSFTAPANIKATNLFAIRPHVYRHDTPSGTITMEVRDSDNKVVVASAAVTITDIGSNTYWHGFYKFEMQTSLRPSATYSIVMVAGGGYSFAEANYAGWCNDYDMRINTAGYTPATGYSAALNAELWVEDWHARKITI